MADAASFLEEEDNLDEEALAACLELLDETPTRRPKAMRIRISWQDEASYKLITQQFDRDYRMSYEAFSRLVAILRPYIQLDPLKGMQASCGYAPISPELTVLMGVRFLTGEKMASLKDIVHCSISSTRRHVRMFLEAVCNSEAKELVIKLPETMGDLKRLANGFSQLSTSEGAMSGVVGALDGWLCTTTSPKKVPNPVDYRSGHYGVFGLNVQAMCDHKQRFTYVCVAAPGKTGDAVALMKCQGLQQFINKLSHPDLHKKFFIAADNAYPLSDTMLIPFSGTQQNDPINSAYNFFLSQLRIRIEMAFGRLTNKWRVFRSPLEHDLEACSLIVQAGMRLHNFVIDYSNSVEDDADIDAVPGIVGQAMRRASIGYIPIQEVDEDAVLYDPVIDGTRATNVNTKRMLLRERIQRSGLRRPIPNEVRMNR